MYFHNCLRLFLFIAEMSSLLRFAELWHFVLTVNEMVSSLTLQTVLYFNTFFFPFWWVSEVIMLQMKYSMLPGYYQCLLTLAVVILTLMECVRLSLGYVGNLHEKVPELAGFWLVTFIIQLPIILFLFTDEAIIILPLERAIHIPYLSFVVFEVVAGFQALKMMTNQLAMRFYLQQFQDSECPQRPERSQDIGVPYGSNSLTSIQ
uniref:Zgc:112294 n=1 Tax=Callorhinchus milii TaxID=7868 RepID=A0A4W3K7U9_CALMI